jgi:spore coat protein U-like protein
MSKLLRYAAVGAALASFGVASGAQAATTAQANATAIILSSLSVRVDDSANTLSFGTIADSGIAADQTIDVSAGGVRGVCPAGLTCAGTITAPTFWVKGAASKAVNVSFVNASETLNYVGTAPTGFSNNTMSVGSFVTDAVNGAVTNQLVLSATAGTETAFHVGGTLTVHPDQAPGTYQGTLTVSVAYN